MPKDSSRSLQSAAALVRHLREYGLRRYPGAHLKSPWPGHLDLAVNDKTFAYLSLEGEPFSISCKLPESNGVALSMPGTTPSSYGLGKSGWVTMSLADGDALPPVELFVAWLDESYRAQAPRRLAAGLDAGGSDAAGKPARRTAKKAAKKTAKKAGKKVGKKVAEKPARKPVRRPARTARKSSR